MRRIATTVLLGCLLAFLGLGCGGDVTPGVNKDKDKPKPPAEQPADKK